jgi:hypothetical protein
MHQTETRTTRRNQQAGTDTSFGSAPPPCSKLQAVQSFPNNPTVQHSKSSKRLFVSLCAISAPAGKAGALCGIQLESALQGIKHRRQFSPTVSRPVTSRGVRLFFRVSATRYRLSLAFTDPPTALVVLLKERQLALGVFPQLPWSGPTPNPTQAPLLNLPSPSELSLYELPLVRVGPKTFATKRLPS